MTKTAGKFMMLPLDFAKTVARFDLSARELQVLLQLYSHKNQGLGLAWPSQLTIARELNLDRDYVRVCVRSLKRKGFIVAKQEHRGVSNRYSFNLSPPAAAPAVKGDEVFTYIITAVPEVPVMSLHPSFTGRENEVDRTNPPKAGEDFDTYQKRVLQEAIDSFNAAGGDKHPVAIPPPPKTDDGLIDDGGFGKKLLQEVLATPEPPEIGTAAYEEFYEKMSTPKPRDEVLQVWVDHEHKHGRNPLAAIAGAEPPEEVDRDGVPEGEVGVKAG